MLRGTPGLKSPFRDAQETDGKSDYRPLDKPVWEYTLGEVKEYCESFEECPQGLDCAFFELCAIWPCDWKL